jgi:AcrR family transcriptional regulator
MARLTNAQRSSATRTALLDATITAIIAYGYHGATSTRIAELSGLTRGAQLHHFKSKAGLVVEALLRLHARRIQMHQHVAAVAADTTLEQVIEDMWRSFDDDMWLAAAELWTAARTDDALRAALIPAEREIGQRIRGHLTAYLAANNKGSIPPQRINAVRGLIMSAMRGMALHEAFDPDYKRAKAQRSELVRALRALSHGNPADGQAANTASTP